MSFMKKGLRKDSRKQKAIIKNQIYMKLNKIVRGHQKVLLPLIYKKNVSKGSVPTDTH